MPELPEVETLRRSLEPRLVGRVIERVEVRRAEVVRSRCRTRAAVSGGGVTRRLRAMLLGGRRIARLERCGKQLAIIAEGGSPVLIVHLGMTGQLLFLARGQSAPREDHIHIRWFLGTEAQGASLLFRDPRRFGRLTPVASMADLLAQEWSRLGPDALGVRAVDLAAALRRTTRGIKAALLDQTVIAGVGNIYADEALHRAGLHPLTPAHCLNEAQLTALAAVIRGVLNRSVRAGGTTLRDYVDSDGRAGGHRVNLLVYGRAGQPCRRCGRSLTSAIVTQRTTTFCANCQPPSSSTIHPHRGWAAAPSTLSTPGDPVDPSHVVGGNADG